MRKVFSDPEIREPDWWAAAGIAACLAALALLALVSAGCASAPVQPRPVRGVMLVEMTIEIDGRVTHHGRTWAYEDEAICPVPVPEQPVR